MKGNAKVIDTLNSLLMDELTVINEYILHSEMCVNWGYKHLHDILKGHAIKEMQHAEKLIARILLMEGKPYVAQLRPMKIGTDVEKIIANDLALETAARESYNAGIKVACEAGDNGSRDLMEDNLIDEESHIDYLEAAQDQIKQMGLENFLSQQL